ncbi:hypothetical protein J6590_086814, partial [Homalodisca vitripennis]
MRTLAVSQTKCSPTGSRFSSEASTSFGQSNVAPPPLVNDVGSSTSIACAPTQVVLMTPPALSLVSRKSGQGLESPTTPLSTTLQPSAASEPRTLLYQSFAEAVKCRSPVRQVGPSSTVTDTTEQKKNSSSRGTADRSENGTIKLR